MKNDHQPEKLWLLNKSSSSLSQEMHREKSGEYKYWCLGLKGESDLKPSHWQPLFISSNNLTHFYIFLGPQPRSIPCRQSVGKYGLTEGKMI